VAGILTPTPNDRHRPPTFATTGAFLGSRNVAVSVGDRWHLGSDTKAITATLLAVLADKGVVGWDLTIAQAFPDWRLYAAKRGPRPLILAAGGVCHFTPQWRRTRSR
jgi:CubicO group peptidase (beta-lactamase class C family)